MPKRSKSKNPTPARHLRNQSVDPLIPPEPDPTTLSSPLEENPFSVLDNPDTSDVDLRRRPSNPPPRKPSPSSLPPTGLPIFLLSNQNLSFKLDHLLNLMDTSNQKIL